ncbi:hypothetical protein PBY51_022903 [Eleginops maclovinus]|uniref:Uncharacterized protein n=1 Tax=Eleginops maclovinus TaxID=56733 RepID=A0AAN7XI45_ELEMC|nr:hypothetical protein PBY51_022903 [Eleginops maclovinus]
MQDGPNGSDIDGFWARTQEAFWQGAAYSYIETEQTKADSQRHAQTDTLACTHTVQQSVSMSIQEASA